MTEDTEAMVIRVDENEDSQSWTTIPPLTRVEWGGDAGVV